MTRRKGLLIWTLAVLLLVMVGVTNARADLDPQGCIDDWLEPEGEHEDHQMPSDVDALVDQCCEDECNCGCIGTIETGVMCKPCAGWPPLQILDKRTTLEWLEALPVMEEAGREETDWNIVTTDKSLLNLNQGGLTHLHRQWQHERPRGACDTLEECEDRLDDLCEVAGHQEVTERTVRLTDDQCNGDCATGRASAFVMCADAAPAPDDPGEAD